MALPFLSQNETLIAIKVPQASYIEVPDPDEVSGRIRCELFELYFYLIA